MPRVPAYVRTPAYILTQQMLELLKLKKRRLDKDKVQARAAKQRARDEPEVSPIVFASATPTKVSCCT